ncbi:Histone acetyltransferase type b catalytic subunit [Paramicrosporidium saccamoebae]|uniref:Histone acetyltransferase type B catalytic subunit n=1 Tax=Paramicrosporidium saccamoebae TaxID=1246581 RepID=A0A2H9TMS6_9FUNG|nr:Histone acetyltransferase type b catalytic subunit [Paramicrosporidium saccamoebae]
MGEPANKRQKTSPENECSSFTFQFGDDAECPASYLHQFYPESDLGEKNLQTRVRVDPKTLLMLFTTASNAEVEDFKRSLGPVLKKFPQEEDYKNALNSSGRLLANAAPIKNSTLRLYKCAPSDATQLTNRMEALLLFFIDGASIIDLSDPKWLLYYLVDEDDRILGFCSAYPFLLFPDKKRLRISQFFIVPPHQRRGLGSVLYRAIMQDAIADEDVKEVTVEDPSDEFCMFKLANDLAMVEAGEPVKVTTLQAELIELANLYRSHHINNEDGEEFVTFRKRVKKYLCKKYPDCIPSEKDKKIAVLEDLFQEEMSKINKVIRRGS